MSASTLDHDRSEVRSTRVAAILGILLGVAFGVCFVTGVLSHLIQQSPGWFRWPSRPAGLYRVTQGVHVATGLASIPLLLAKLWVVVPKFVQRPVFRDAAHALERLSLVPLVGGAIFQVWSGVANINQWYPWPFGFRFAHYWVAWITVGALVVHAGAKWHATRQAFAREAVHGEAGVERRRFLFGVFATAGALTLFTVGQTLRPLERLALLAPRRPSVGPQGFPVNRTARGRGVVDAATNPGYRLVVDGRVRDALLLSIEELRAMPQHEATLPIACVEGWSTSQRWRGVRIRDLLDRAGATDHAEAVVHSLQRGYSAPLNESHARDRDTLLALEVNHEPLHLDHGYPVRLIGPNRPGTMQVKWVSRLEVR